MPVTVSFRGICLFAIQGGRLAEVLLPEAEFRQPRESKRTGRHVDDTPARPHFAGIFIPRKLNHTEIGELDITIEGRDATDLPAAGELSHLPALPVGGVDGLVVDRDAPHASIKLKGGAITTTRANRDRAFEFLGQANRRDQVEVTYNEFVTIRIGSLPPLDLDPDDNDQVYIFNFDDKKPKKPLIDDGKKAEGIVILDHDFKWHFLVAVPPGIDANKLERWSKGVLPCPVSVEPRGPKTVSGSTCYPATIVEPEARRSAGRTKKKR